jgi:hypothetical protein
VQKRHLYDFKDNSGNDTGQGDCNRSLTIPKFYFYFNALTDRIVHCLIFYVVFGREYKPVVL